MEPLVKILILSACILHTGTAQEKVKRSIFSWSKEAEEKEAPVVPGYLPPITVHKYHGVQINPANGPPLYLPGSDLPQSDDALKLNQFQGGQLPPQYASQLELLKHVAPFLPDEGKLQDYEATAFLPYADLISEDALNRIQYVVEEKTPQESKLLKLIGFLRYLKELKLKPFKAAANFGATLFNKKKQTVSNFLNLGSSSQTYPLEDYPIDRPVVEPPYYPGYPFQPPPNDESQQQPQPVDAPTPIGSENRVNPSYGHLPSHPQITPPNNFLAYPPYPVVIPPRHDFESPTLLYPQPFQSLSFHQPRYQHPGNAESTPAPYQQPPKTRTYPEQPYASKSSNVPTYQVTEQPIRFPYQQFAGQQNSQKYPPTSANTHANRDLAGSASDNVEKIEQTSGPVNVQTPVIKKEEPTVATVDNHQDESLSKPKTTKLRTIETRPPVVVYPNTPAESKSTTSESTSLPQPLATISAAHQSSK